MCTKMLRRLPPTARFFKRHYTEAVLKNNTVDDKEIMQFDKLVSEWWDLGGPLKPLHSMNRLRVPFIRDGLINSGLVKREHIDTPKPLQSLHILDVGCGGGILAEPLSRLGCNVTGLDASADLIEIAKKHSANRNLNVTYIKSNLEEYCEKNREKYDAVVASEVLEHVTHKDLFIEALIKCLKPGGSVFISTINKTYWSYLGTIVMGEQILRLLPQGTHEYEKFIAPHHVQRHLEDQNCKMQLIHGLFYNVINNKWSWISDYSMNYVLRAIKL